jgi:hypothetical protein
MSNLYGYSGKDTYEGEQAEQQAEACIPSRAAEVVVHKAGHFHGPSLAQPAASPLASRNPAFRLGHNPFSRQFFQGADHAIQTGFLVTESFYCLL